MYHMVLGYLEIYEEKKKHYSEDHMLVRIWKVVRFIFMCAFLYKEILWLTKEDIEEFSFINDRLGQFGCHEPCRRLHQLVRFYPRS